MKKGVLILTSSVFLFSYELAVKLSDAQKLKDCGISCQIRGDKCVFAKSFDKFQLKRVKAYVKKEYGIDSFFVKESVKKQKVTPTYSFTYQKPKIVKNESTSFIKHIYSYQVGTFKNISTAIKIFNKIKNYPYARIEKIGKYYVVRFGMFKSYKEAKAKKSPYFLLKCYYIPKRIIKGNNENSNFNKG